MAYIIDVFGSQRLEKEIDKEFFSRIQLAQNALVTYHAIEQRYDIFLENYIAFEARTFELLVGHTLRHGKIFDPADATASEIDRCLINLLSSGKGYGAQVKRYRPQDNDSQIIRLLDALREHSVEYRVVDGLRDHIQHFSLLVHGWDLSACWTGDDNASSRRRHSLMPYVTITGLTKDERNKKKLLANLTVLPSDAGKIPLLPLLRKYVEDVSGLHKAVRDILNAEFQQTKTTISETQRIGSELGSTSTESMFAYQTEACGAVIDRIYLGSKLQSSIESMISKNPVPLSKFGRVEFLS